MRRIQAAFLILALCICMNALAEENERIFVENEWNYVDQSMDIEDGIPGNAGGVLARIRKRGRLRVAMEPFFPPQEFIDATQTGQDRFAGADVDLAKMIAEYMDVELEIVPMDFVDVLPALTEDKCDLAISALAFTPSRASGYTLGNGYYFAESQASTCIVIREEDRDAIRTIKDLEDKTLIVQSGSVQETMAAENIQYYLEFRRVSQSSLCYEAVMKGEADAAVMDMETMKNYIEDNPGCGLVLMDDVYFQLDEAYKGDRIAAKKGELQLMYFVNGVIEKVVNRNLYDRWLTEAEKRIKELGL